MSWHSRVAASVLAICFMSTPAFPQPVHSIDWDDADSGRINGVKFRLADVDAPETTPVGWVNGAKCAEERSLGREALSWLLDALGGKTIAITGRDPDLDDRKRLVVTLSVDGNDLGELGVAAGRYKPYVFDNRKPLMKKPKWCPGEAARE